MKERKVAMRYTKAMVREIVQAARCKDCGGNYQGAMMLRGNEIICSNCNYAATLV